VLHDGGGWTPCNLGRGSHVQRGMQIPVQAVQAPVPAAPSVPSAPPAPPAPLVPTAAPSGVLVAPGVPRTGDQLAALRRHRSEISDQLTSVQHRRDELARQLRNPMVGGADRAGIEQRLTVVDGRIVSLERDLDATGQLVAASPTSLLTSAGSTGGLRGLGFQRGLATGAGIALAAALLYARLFRRRRVTSAPTPATDSARLARLEQAIEAVAIEVERISEGQRFVAQLLAERRDDARIAAPAFAAAPGEALR